MRILKSRSEHERSELKRMRLQHVEAQRNERLHYYSNRAKAMASPDHALSIIIDGMDQAKTNVPLYSRKTSERVLTQRLLGVKVHGIGNWVFLVDSTVRGGGNLITEVLRRTLLEVEKLGKLPSINPVLYLQLDNCSENKNRTLFAFLNDLVHRNIFAEVHAGFLMVGHTHEDIDQFFSTISSWLKKFDTICPDVPSFIQAIGNAFTNSEKMKSQKPAVIQLNASMIHDYDIHYEPHINKELAHHSQPHQFRFKKFDGIVLCHYKMWAVDAEYLPKQTSTVEQQAAASFSDCLISISTTEPSSNQTSASEQTKKRKFTRGASKPKFKCPKPNKLQKGTQYNDAEDSVSEDEEKNEHPMMLDSVVAGDPNLKVYAKGICWLTSLPSQTNPAVVIIPSSTKTINADNVCSFKKYIFEKATTTHPDLFTQQVLANWETWATEQLYMWNSWEECCHATIFQWPSSFFRK